MINLKKRLEEGVDAIRARKDDPVVNMRVRDKLVKLPPVAWRFDTDGGQFESIRSQNMQTVHQFAGLLAGAGHRDAPSEQREAFKPVELVPKTNHVAEDGDCGRFEPGFLRALSDVRERACERRLGPGRCAAHDGDGGSGRHPGGFKFRGNGLEPHHPHQHDLRPRRCSNRSKVRRRIRFARFLMPGENRQH